jgi:Fe2+ transport system protein FeoA
MHILRHGIFTGTGPLGLRKLPAFQLQTDQMPQLRLRNHPRTRFPELFQKPVLQKEKNIMKSSRSKTFSNLRLFQLWLEEGMMSFLPPKTREPMYQSNPSQKPSQQEKSLDRLKKGETGMVTRLITSDSKNLQKLLAMGILPGRIVKVLQTYPAYILQIDRTQAAMDRELAKRIIVKN